MSILPFISCVLSVEDLPEILKSPCSFLCVLEPFGHIVSTAKLRLSGIQMTCIFLSKASKWLASFCPAVQFWSYMLQLEP